METCHDCYEEFDGFRELAMHIISQKKTHNKKSRFWALKFLAQKNNTVELKKIAQSPDYEETEFGKENRESAVRHLSGESEIVRTVCPNCKQVTNQRLEAEYLTDRYTWRNSNGTLIVNCDRCKKVRNGV
jgi:hypothetical protein